MAVIILVDLGTPNAGDGDPLRGGGVSINANFEALNVAKLETGGYTGTAQDLFDLIDGFGDNMTKPVYDPNLFETDAFDSLNMVVDDSAFDVIIGLNSQDAFASTDTALLNARQTGFKNGYVTLNGALGVATSFNHESLSGEILQIADPINPVYTTFKVPSASGLLPPNGLVYYYIDPSTPTVLSNTTTIPTEAQRRQRAYLFRVNTVAGVITGIDSERTLIQQNSNALRELYKTLGDGRKSGLDVTNTAAADLSFRILSGVASGYDLDPTDYENPHNLSLAEFNTSTGGDFREATISGVLPTLQTQVRVDQRQDVGGALVTISNNKYSVWYVAGILGPEGNNFLVPENISFDSSDLALISLSRARMLQLATSGFTETFIYGAIITKKGVTNFNVGDVTFATSNNRGDFGTGSGSQGAYTPIIPTLEEVISENPNATSVPSFGNGISYTPIAPPTYQEGSVWYDSTIKALSYYNDEADVKINVGQENVIRVRNTTGSTIINGQAVYISGAQGANLPLVSLAQADARETARCIGLATHDIENNSNGYITTLGIVGGLDTSGFTAGDPVFLSTATAGALTQTRPTTGFAVVIGDVTVSNVSIGEIKVISGTTAQRADLATIADANAEYLMFAASDEDTVLAVSTGVLTFRMPYGMTLSEVRASVKTAPTGSVLTTDINQNGTSILSTKITIDAGEKTSETAVTPPVISTASLTDDAEITIDIDTVGGTIAGTGLKITLIGLKT